MSKSPEIYQVVNLFDWTGGVRNKRQNPLTFPPNALAAGENVDLVDGGLRTRRGLEYHTAGSGAFGSGSEVVCVKQVRFPTNESSYMLAQVNSGGSSSLRISTDPLPVDAGSGTWTQIYDLGSGAGMVSVALLNDRAVIAEGDRNPPLVFAGGMDPSATDWAVPRAVIVTYDSGENWHDITSEVCDTDPDTYADLGGLDPESGWLAICSDMSGVNAFHFEMESGNTQSGGLIVEGYSGSWTSGAGWTDGTDAFSGTGAISHSGGVFEAKYHVENSFPGYWTRVRFESGTSVNTLLRRVLFQAPCQALQVIGEGLPDILLGFLFQDNSAQCVKDFTVEVSDNTFPTYARLNDGNAASPVGMNSGDAIYAGYLTPFDALDIRVHNDYPNTNPATLSGDYWDGSAWSPLSGFVDGTIVGTDTLAQKGRVSWITPSDWRQNRPESPQYPHGYWIRLKVTTYLNPNTYISEARVWPVMTPLKRHRFALTVRDRMVLCGRTDAPDQIDISRPLEEYGFAGTDSSSFRIGGQDGIVAAEQAFNQGFIAKTEDWFLLNGYSAETFSVERAEAAGQAPINNRVVVRAPHTEADLKNLMGLYYINQAGAWYFAGLKVYQLSQDVSWWDPGSAAPRLDLDNLHKACGVYWPERNWVIWSVPMSLDGQSQWTNNTLIIYDLTLRSWLPRFEVALASMGTAYHHIDGAPGKLGQLGLYGGDYQGNIVRLFGPGQTTDFGQPIAAWAETGWLHFGSPEFRKLLRLLTIYGKTAGGEITLKVFTDGDTSTYAEYRYDQLDDMSERLFAQEQKPQNVAARFFKFRVEFTDVTDVFGLQVGLSVIREWGQL